MQSISNQALNTNTGEVHVLSQERQKMETGELSLEAKCASCWDAQTPFLRVHSLPVTLRMKNNSAALPGFLKIRITIDKIFKDQDGIQNIQSLAEAPHKHLSPSLLHCKLERTSCETWVHNNISASHYLLDSSVPPPPLTTWKTKSTSTTTFQPHILLRGAQDSAVGCGAVLAWRIINQYWEERLRRAMFCRNFSMAAASWVAEREAPLSLPVIHHQTTRNLNIPNNRPDTGTIPNADDGEGIRIIRD